MTSTVKPTTDNSQSLTQFVDEIKADIDQFAANYKAKHLANPEMYPLVLGADNSGLWLEFFVDYVTSGIV